MTKIIGPLLSLDASGSIAKTIIYSKYKGINTAKGKVISYDPKSTDQIYQRSLFQGAIYQWNLLDQPTKDEYTQRVKGLSLTGYNKYIKMYLNTNKGIPAPVIPTAPTIYSVDGQTSSPYTGNDSTPDVVINDVLNGDLVTIYDGETNVGSGTASNSTITIKTSALTEVEHSLTAKIDRNNLISEASNIFLYTFLFDPNNIFISPSENDGKLFASVGGNNYLKFINLTIVAGGGSAFFMMIHRDLGENDGVFVGNYLTGCWNNAEYLTQVTDSVATPVGSVILECSPGDDVALEFDGSNFIAYKNGIIVDSVPVTITTDSNFIYIYTQGADTWDFSTGTKL